MTGNGKNRQSENDDREDVFIGGLWLNALGADKWTIVKIVDYEKSVNFLIDTGADISCVPTSVGPEQMLQIVKKTEEPISGPDGYCLNVIGFMDLVFETKDKQTRSKVFMISGLQTAILGRQCLQNLGIVCFKEGRYMLAKLRGECGLASEFSEVNVPVESPELVNGLGKIKGTIKTVLKDEAKPFVQSVHRTVSITLLNKLKAEIDRLIQLDIIEPVMEPTEWVAPIVVVPKGNAVRICGDYTELNH
ncbi:hypothetical protein PR048_028957 [Dryococelus australis]|uniref:Peptidase A2 domain-containing protein n=1 Tax=Dryococelus australis TaxID=614101 RepID=A0ABQ9GC30_9NEOP|nr:hypothetical protein PR048_028957 [Dryococelus australis]